MRHLTRASWLLALIFVFCGACVQPVVTPGPSSPAPPVPPAPMCAPVLSDTAWYTSGRAAPLFEGLAGVAWAIAHRGDSVQRYFDQGLMLAYGFNHAEAARSFHYATRLDPDCAMAHWGYAYVLGPNYNAPMAPEAYPLAYASAARALAAATDPLERALAEALLQRYTPTAPAERTDLDETYAYAMAEVHARFPENADVSVLYAEALLDLHPWQLYDAEGAPQPWTIEIVAALERALALQPEHAGAHHFRIHATEASRRPEAALASAELLAGGLVPAAGHLVHMPAHVFIRTGDYHAGTLANLRAIAADTAYLTACRAQGAYPLTYYPHNQHFLAATATLEGDGETAVYAAEQVAANANAQLMREPHWATLQHFSAIPLFVLAKFGRWDDILTRARPADELEYPRAIRHYATGMALLNTGRPAAAQRQLDSLDAIARGGGLDRLTIWEINALAEVVAIGSEVLRGELCLASGDYAGAVAAFRSGVDLEDGLNYNEPPDWFFSVRHHLGAALSVAGRSGEAADVFEEDLRRLPRNGWALSGLADAYDAAGDAARAAEARARFAIAWANADTELEGAVAVR